MQRSWASTSTSTTSTSKGVHAYLPVSSATDPKAYPDGCTVRAVRNIDVAGKVVVRKDTQGTTLAPTQDSMNKGRVRICFESRADGGKISQAILVLAIEITEVELSGEYQSSVCLPGLEMGTSEKLGQLDLEEIEPQMLNVGTQIGQGRFKKVFTGNHKAYGPVAVLCYAAGSDQHEARILGRLAKMEFGDFHFAELYGAKEDPSGDLLLAQELSMLGSVRSVLKEQDLAPLLTPTHKLHIAAQIAGAVDFLENAHIIHTDLACRNAMLFQLEDELELTTVKLTDFGCALILPPNSDHIVNKQPQATRWCAPETVVSMTWSHKTDIWSLGALLWELFADGAAPWQGLSKRSDVANKLRELSKSGGSVNDEFPAPQPGVYPVVAHTAALSCLQVDPALRPPACAVALAFEKLLDLSDMFDGNFDPIDEGLEMVAAPAMGLPQSQSPPVHERSRPRKRNSCPRSECLTEPSIGNPNASTAISARLVPPQDPRLEDAQQCHTPERQVSAVYRQLSARRASDASSINQSAEVSTALGNGSSIVWTPNRLDASSTPSTADTPTPRTVKARPQERMAPVQQQQQQQEQHPARTQNHFEFLSKFVESQEAAQGICCGQLDAMRLEIASAQVREAYWSGVSERSDLKAMLDPESTKVVVPLEPRGGSSWGLRDQAPLQSGKWTLWTYVSPALRREDFSNAVQAMDALSSRNECQEGGAPCILRDPSGKVLGRSCWTTSRT